MLEKSGEATFFVRICVDRDIKTKKRHPSIVQYNITEVPSIIVENKLLEGISAFNWLCEKIQSSQDKVNSIPTRQNKPQESIKQLNKDPSDSFQPYTDLYSNYTDSCLVISKDTQDMSIITQDVDSEVTKSNNFLLKDDNLTSTAINTQINHNNDNKHIPSITIKKDSLKSKQINNEYNKLLAERDESVPQQQQRI